MFDIDLIGKPEYEGERLFVWGRLRLNQMSEEFQAPLYDWAPGDFTAQWLDAAERLVAGAPCVVFVTHYVRSDAAYHLGWPAWAENGHVHVQERLFLRDKLEGPFDPMRAEEHVGPRATISEEDEPIAEWQVRLADIAAYLDRRRTQPEPAAAAEELEQQPKSNVTPRPPQRSPRAQRPARGGGRKPGRRRGPHGEGRRAAPPE